MWHRFGWQSIYAAREPFSAQPGRVDKKPRRYLPRLSPADLQCKSMLRDTSSHDRGAENGDSAMRFGFSLQGLHQGVAVDDARIG